MSVTCPRVQAQARKTGRRAGHAWSNACIRTSASRMLSLRVSSAASFPARNLACHDGVAGPQRAFLRAPSSRRQKRVQRSQGLIRATVVYDGEDLSDGPVERIGEVRACLTVK